MNSRLQGCELSYFNYDVGLDLISMMTWAVIQDLFECINIWLPKENRVVKEIIGKEVEQLFKSNLQFIEQLCTESNQYMLEYEIILDERIVKNIEIF